MLAIIKREFYSLFHNVIGWIFVGATLASYGLYFFAYNLYYGYPYINSALSGMSFILIITGPILTMRVIAEERHSKTDQLLLTSPVSLGRIILAKYIALVAVFTICIAVISISPLVLSLFGEVPMLESYVYILSFWMYGCATLAVGIFVSSITESQVIAAVVSFVILYLANVMTSLTSMVFGDDSIFTTIFNCFDIYTPMETMLYGVFSLTSILYYITFAGIFLFLTYEVMQKRRWTATKRTLTTSAFSIVTIIAVLVVSVLVNYGASLIPVEYTQLDATSKKMYTITDETKEYIESLEDDITIYVYVAESSADENVDITLRRYAELSSHITLTYIDPTEDLDFEDVYTDDGLSTNDIIVVSDERYKVISYSSDVYEYEYSIDYTTYSYSYEVVGYDCEGQVTAAIQYVLSDVTTVIYELTGHDETSYDGDFADIFDKKFFTVESLDLLQVDEVPDDCAMLFIHAPMTDLSSDDLAKIEAYIEAGGNVFLDIYYGYWSSLENFNKLLSDYGVTTTTSIVMEDNSSYYYSSYQYNLLPYVESTTYSTDVTGSSSIFMPYSIGLIYDDGSDDADEEDSDDEDSDEEDLEDSEDEDSDDADSEEEEADEEDSEDEDADTEEEETVDTSAFTYTSFITTSDSSYDYADGTVTGPFSLGLVVTNETGGSLVITGSAYTYLDSTNEYVSGRNAKLFTNIIDALIDEDGSSASIIVISSKDLAFDYLTITGRALIVYGLIWGMVIPLISIIVGIVIWALRRKK